MSRKILILTYNALFGFGGLTFDFCEMAWARQDDFFDAGSGDLPVERLGTEVVECASATLLIELFSSLVFRSKCMSLSRIHSLAARLKRQRK